MLSPFLHLHHGSTSATVQNFCKGLGLSRVVKLDGENVLAQSPLEVFQDPLHAGETSLQPLSTPEPESLSLMQSLEFQSLFSLDALGMWNVLPSH